MQDTILKNHIRQLISHARTLKKQHGDIVGQKLDSFQKKVEEAFAVYFAEDGSIKVDLETLRDRSNNEFATENAPEGFLDQMEGATDGQMEHAVSGLRVVLRQVRCALSENSVGPGK